MAPCKIVVLSWAWGNVDWVVFYGGDVYQNLMKIRGKAPAFMYAAAACSLAAVPRTILLVLMMPPKHYFLFARVNEP